MATEVGYGDHYIGINTLSFFSLDDFSTIKFFHLFRNRLCTAHSISVLFQNFPIHSLIKQTKNATREYLDN